MGTTQGAKANDREQGGGSKSQPARWLIGPMIEVIGLLQAESDWTWKHSGRVARYAVAFGRSLDLDPHTMMVLQCAAILHDVGKVSVPRELLDKASSLDPDEWYTITKHPVTSSRMLKSYALPLQVVITAQSHHEWYDGKGYPMGLEGEAIPIAARVVSLADAYDAMSTDRPYRAALQPDRILEELDRGAGTQFDPYLAGKLRGLLIDGVDLSRSTHRLRVISDDPMLYMQLWFAAYPWGWDIEAWPPGWARDCPVELLAPDRPGEAAHPDLTMVDSRCLRRVPPHVTEHLSPPVLWLDPVDVMEDSVHRPLDLQSLMRYINPGGEEALDGEREVLPPVRVLIADPYHLFRQVLRRYLDHRHDLQVVAEVDSPASYRRARVEKEYDVAVVASDLLAGTRSTAPLRTDDWLIDDEAHHHAGSGSRSIVLVTDDDMSPEIQARIWSPGDSAEGPLYVYRGAPAEVVAEAILHMARGVPAGDQGGIG